MGLTCSYELTSQPSAAKLIFKNGRLEEFSRPVRVSQLLQKSPNFFICNADDMKYDDYIPAIDGDEELQLGQIYFALPVNWLKSKLELREMAALAVTASSALKATAGRRWRNWRRVHPMVYGYTGSKKSVEFS